MKKLCFVFSYLAETVKRHPLTIVLIVMSTIVGSFVSTLTYGIMRVEVGDVMRMNVPSYVVMAKEGEWPTYNQMAEMLVVAASLDSYSSREDSVVLDKATFFVCDENGESDEILGPLVTISWRDGLFDEYSAQNLSDIVLLPRYIADDCGLKSGDTIVAYGTTLTVVGTDAAEVTLPLTARLSGARLVETDNATLLAFIPERVLTEDEKAVFGAAMLSSYKGEYFMFIFFVLSIVLGALCTLIDCEYIARRSAYKYAVAKMLGATNGDIAAAVFAEQFLFSVPGIAVGCLSCVGICSALGYFGKQAFMLGVTDVLMIVAANLAVVLAFGLYSVIKRAVAQPCDRR